VGWGEGKESIVDIGRNAKEPLRAIIRALQDTDDGAAGFRAEVELASRWTKLNCDYGTVHNLHVLYCTVLNNLRLRSCFEMTAVRAQTTPMFDSDRCRFDAQSVDSPSAWRLGILLVG
jgi:hypothetical protein